MSSPPEANLVVVGLPIPRGMESFFCTVTIGHFIAFKKTKGGKMEETVFAKRFETTLTVDDVARTYYDTIEVLQSQCQSISAQYPEEESSCRQLYEVCEEMLRIAKSPVPWYADFMKFPIEVRNRIYEMVVGGSKSIVYHCNNAYHDQVSCPAGYCKPCKNDLGNGDLKEALALAQTSKQVNLELTKLLCQNATLYFSCTCSLSLCLSKNESVRDQVRRLKLHLRGAQSSSAIALLRSCPKLTHLEVLVSKWSTTDSPSELKRLLTAAWPDTPLKTASGVAELLEVRYLESVKVSNAVVEKEMPNRNKFEVENFETYLKERLEHRGLLRVNIAELNHWLDQKI